VLTIRVSSVKEYEEILERLQDQAPLLDIIGGRMKAEAQDAFSNQSFGGISWPARYPRQKAPHVNIAGVVRDFAEGRTAPKANRFVNRRAAVDTGALQDSITYSVSEGVVTIGSSLPYAEAHNAGLKETQEITPAIKAALSAWMDSITPRSRNWKRAPKAKRQQKEVISGVKSKLGFLLEADELETKIAARPFLGVTPELQKALPNMVESWIATGSV